jgi:hypothetical protein
LFQVFYRGKNIAFALDPFEHLSDVPGFFWFNSLKTEGII